MVRNMATKNNTIQTQIVNIILFGLSAFLCISLAIFSASSLESYILTLSSDRTERKNARCFFGQNGRGRSHKYHKGICAVQEILDTAISSTSASDLPESSAVLTLAVRAALGASETEACSAEASTAAGAAATEMLFT